MIRAVLCDLSGTLFVDRSPISGAVAALKRLRQTGVKLLFVTNTTKESNRILHERVSAMNFDISRQEIFTCLTAARKMLDSQRLRPFMLVDDQAMEDFDGVPTEDPNCVLVGLAPDKLNYDNMTLAFRVLFEQPESELIAIHKSRYFQAPEGMVLGPGPFVQALEYATSRTAIVVGKPEAEFYLSALKRLGVDDPAEAVMIGDDARIDVHGAQQCGLKGILVKTGKYRENDENKVQPAALFVANDFPQAVEHILPLLG